MNNVILLGPPGAGKGTIAKMVKEKLDIPHISTGDIFRYNVKNNTDLGKQAKEFMDSGKLVPDELTIKMVKDRLTQDDCSKGFLLDGYPRTIPQADALKETGITINHVLYFMASQELIIRRMTNRRTCKNCGAIFNILTVPPKNEGVCDRCQADLVQRADETPEVIKKRLDIYAEQTAPLINYYKELELLREVDASTNPEDITNHVLRILE